MIQVFDSPIIKPLWIVRKYKNNQDYANRNYYEKNLIPRNILLNEGIGECLDLLGGIAGTNAYNNANARIGVGNAEAATGVTGTSITMTNGSTAVTGSSTSFSTQLAVGDIIKVDASSTYGEIASIESNTALTLVANYTGATNTGAGSFINAPIATHTDLQGSIKTYKAMETSYPSRSNQTMTWRSIFIDTEAEHQWLEFSLSNQSSGAGENLNRRLNDQGTKAAGQTWTIDLQLTLS